MFGCSLIKPKVCVSRCMSVCVWVGVCGQNVCTNATIEGQAWDSRAAKHTIVHERVRWQPAETNLRRRLRFSVHFSRGRAATLFLSVKISLSLFLPLFSLCVIILLSCFLAPSIFCHAPSAFISPLSCAVFLIKSSSSRDAAVAVI